MSFSFCLMSTGLLTLAAMVKVVAILGLDQFEGEFGKREKQKLIKNKRIVPSRVGGTQNVVSIADERKNRSVTHSTKR